MDGRLSLEGELVIVHALQKYVLNPPIKLLFAMGVAPPGYDRTQDRACALTGNTAKSRTAYQDFFALWKDADPDIPILKEAKAEYAKLK